MELNPQAQTRPKSKFYNSDRENPNIGPVKIKAQDQKENQNIS